MVATRPDTRWGRADVDGMDLDARNMHAALQERMFGVSDEPIRLGRFVVLERLGAGGMGVVYAAYDPTLDRKIAVKLVHREIGDALGDGVLLNEAQALARLAHPGVVAVHDVGNIGDRIFIAMEFIDGEPLSRWDAAERGWEATLTAYIEAGEGLAAAHKAGVVHGDFKPDNALIGKDGRVRVVDFGLARRSGMQAGDTGTGSEPGPGPTGGTPQYMAPEQILGEGADARSDQFSFCVALSEALYGEHPFGGKSWLELAEAVTSGALRSTMHHPYIPAHVQHALQQGMLPSPDARFATMDALLDALRPRPVARWQRAAVMGTLVVFAGGIGYAVAGRATVPPPCTGSAARLAGVWGDDVRAEMQTSFARTKARFAVHAAAEASATLDAYARSWALVHRDLCMATVVAREHPIADTGQRMRCLERRLSELEALTTVLRDADAQTVTKALAAAQSLEPPRGCATAGMRSGTLTEAEREINARLDEARGQALAWHATGKVERAATLVEDALGLARQLGDPREVADVQYTRGAFKMARDDATAAIPLLLESITGAERSGDDDLRGRGLGEMVLALTSLERFEEALRYGALARAAFDRVQAPEARRLPLELAIGFAYSRNGDYEQATRVLTETLERAKGIEGDRGGQLLLALAYSNLGLVQRDRGDEDAALANLDRALQIRVASFGSEHPDVAVTRYNIATVLLQSARWEEALDQLRAAQIVHEQTAGPASLDVAYTERGLGICAAELGRQDEALRHYDRAAEIFERTGDAALSELALLLVDRALLARGRGDADAALAFDRRAAAILEERSGPEHVDLSYALVGIGEDLLALGRVEEAAVPFERALALRVDRGLLSEAVAEARFGLARSLADTDRQRARVLAGQAAREFDEAGSTTADDVRAFLQRLQSAPR